MKSVKNRGSSKPFLIFSLIVTALALPVGLMLVKQTQETRRKAVWEIPEVPGVDLAVPTGESYQVPRITTRAVPSGFEREQFSGGGWVPPEIENVVGDLPEEYQNLLPGGREGRGETEGVPRVQTRVENVLEEEDFVEVVPDQVLDQLPGGYQDLLPEGAAGEQRAGQLGGTQGLSENLTRVFDEVDCSSIDCAPFDMDGDDQISESDILSLIDCLENNTCQPEDFGFQPGDRIAQGSLTSLVGCCISLEDAKMLWDKYGDKLKELVSVEIEEYKEKMKEEILDIPDISEVDCSIVDCSLGDFDNNGVVSNDDIEGLKECVRSGGCQIGDYDADGNGQVNLDDARYYAACCLTDEEIDNLIEERREARSTIFPTISLRPQLTPSPSYGQDCPLFMYGDGNCDNLIDDLDYVVWWSSYGKSTRADFNSDGQTDDLDYVIWWKHYGNKNIPL